MRDGNTLVKFYLILIRDLKNVIKNIQEFMLLA